VAVSGGVWAGARATATRVRARQARSQAAGRCFMRGILAGGGEEKGRPWGGLREHVEQIADQLALARCRFSRLELSARSTRSSDSRSVMLLTCATSLTMKYLARSYIFFSRKERLLR